MTNVILLYVSLSWLPRRELCCLRTAIPSSRHESGQWLLWCIPSVYSNRICEPKSGARVPINTYRQEDCTDQILQCHAGRVPTASCAAVPTCDYPALLFALCIALCQETIAERRSIHLDTHMAHSMMHGLMALQLCPAVIRHTIAHWTQLCSPLPWSCRGRHLQQYILTVYSMRNDL